MDKRDCYHALADMYEREYEIDKELNEIRLKLIIEDNEERKNWFLDAQSRLLQEKDDLTIKIQEFIAKNSSTLDN
ncbi:MAG: hypothetical protein HFJ42_01050 [Clostridia bacterium]|nr:hypothetical protein [Clostridia bacterium]